MAKNREDIRDLVRDWLDEETAADWTDAEINVLINVYYHKIHTAVVDVFDNYEITTALSNTVADQQEYSLPSDHLKLRRVEINYDIDNSDSAPQRALPMNMDSVRRDLGQVNLGVTINRGPAYYIIGDSIGFVPIPTLAGTNAIKVWYSPVRSDLSNDTTSIDIPYPDRDYLLIAYGATAEALRFGQQESTEADKFDAKYDRGIQRMKEELEDRITEESKYVVDVQGDSFDLQGGLSGYGY